MCVNTGCCNSIQCADLARTTSLWDGNYSLCGTCNELVANSYSRYPDFSYQLLRKSVNQFITAQIKVIPNAQGIFVFAVPLINSNFKVAITISTYKGFNQTNPVILTWGWYNVGPITQEFSGTTYVQAAPDCVGCASWLNQYDSDIAIIVALRKGLTINVGQSGGGTSTLSTGAIVGIVIGALAAVAAIAVILILIVKSKASSNDYHLMQDAKP